MTGSFEVRAVGVVRSQFTDPRHTPVQAALNADDEAVIEVDALYRDALGGLSGFSHVWLLCWLGRDGDESERPPLKQVPFLLRSRAREFGIFATRGPRRVNPVGLSLVRLLSVDETTVHFAGVDLVDGTPVLDIKPYVTRFDAPLGDVRCGWFDDVELVDGSTPEGLSGQAG